VEILKPLHEAVHTKVLVIWPSVWILRHDNAPAHKDLSVKQFLTQKTITEMEYPRYSSDLAPNDFRLLPKMSASKGLRFQDTESTPPPQKKKTTALKSIPQQEFEECYWSDEVKLC
jgi:hypothetical protein